MAEYIDREQIERVRLEGSFYFVEHFKGDGIYCTIDAPTADVVERSKVDGAIEDMERYSVAADYEGEKEISKAIDKCVEILKKNIGE